MNYFSVIHVVWYHKLFHFQFNCVISDIACSIFSQNRSFVSANVCQSCFAELTVTIMMMFMMMMMMMMIMILT